MAASIFFILHLLQLTLFFSRAVVSNQQITFDYTDHFERSSWQTVLLNVLYLYSVSDYYELRSTAVEGAAIGRRCARICTIVSPF